MIKLAVIIPTLRGSGCERVVSQLLFDFENKFLVDLIMYTNDISYDIPNVNILLLGTDNSPKHGIIYKLIRIFRRIIALSILLQQNKYDVVFSFIDMCNVYTCIAHSLISKKSKLIISERTISEAFFKCNSYAGKNKTFIKWLIKHAYNHADCIVTLSYAMNKYLHEIGIKTKLKVIYNGVNLEKFNINKNENQKLEQVFINAKIRMIYVATFVGEGKNHGFLINLMPQVRVFYPDAKLFFIGEGPERLFYENEVSRFGLDNIIHFLGWKINVEDYLKESHIYLSSSLSEGSPNAIVEALACGLPIVTMNSTYALAELLSNGKYGSVVKIDSQNDFLSAIKYELEKDRPTKKEKFEYVRENYELNTMKSNYCNLINQIAVSNE